MDFPIARTFGSLPNSEPEPSRASPSSPHRRRSAPSKARNFRSPRRQTLPATHNLTSIGAFSIPKGPCLAHVHVGVLAPVAVVNHAFEAWNSAKSRSGMWAELCSRAFCTDRVQVCSPQTSEHNGFHPRGTASLHGVYCRGTCREAKTCAPAGRTLDLPPRCLWQPVAVSHSRLTTWRHRPVRRLRLHALQRELRG